jgi:curved DNA-binding protein CbpA
MPREASAPENTEPESMDPYEILKVPSNADDAAIRKAYLDLVRTYPPEQFPERFKQIAAAYQRLKDRDHRLHYDLFDRDPGIESPCEALLDNVRQGKRVPLDFEAMKRYLCQCVKP